MCWRKHFSAVVYVLLKEEKKRKDNERRGKLMLNWELTLRLFGWEGGRGCDVSGDACVGHRRQEDKSQVSLTSERRRRRRHREQITRQDETHSKWKFRFSLYLEYKLEIKISFACSARRERRRSKFWNENQRTLLRTAWQTTVSEDIGVDKMKQKLCKSPMSNFHFIFYKR